MNSSLEEHAYTCGRSPQVQLLQPFDYCSTHARPLVSRAHPPGIYHNRVLYRLPKNNLLQRSSGAVVTFSLANVLYGRQYSNRLSAETVKGFQISTFFNYQFFKWRTILASHADVLLARHAMGKGRVTKP